MAAAVLLAGLPPSAASTRRLPEVTLRVSVPQHTYADGTERAGFVLRGACVAPSDEVTVSAGCSAPATSGTLRSAVLGFDARRRSETVPVDAPLAQTPQAGDTEQLQVAEVAVRRRGRLTIVMEALRSRAGRPQPVDGSPSDGGRIEGSAAVWRLGVVQPGTYTVSARFTPGAATGGRFMPQTTVTLAGAAPWRTRFGAVPNGPGIVDRTSTLVFEQRRIPFSRAPEMRGGAFHAHGRQPLVWAAESRAVARGAYDPETSGRRSATSRLTLPGRYPGARHLNSASLTFATLYESNAPKFEPDGGFVRGRNSAFRGFRTSVGTVDASADQPLAGRIWDGDYGRYGFTMNAGAVHARRKRSPRDDRGILVTRWDGSTAEVWTQVETARLPATEAAPPGSPGLAPVGLLHQREASLPVLASGGDLDNRGGSETVWGRPLRFEVPENAGSQTIFTSWSAPPRSRYVAEVDESAGGVTITPGVEPGGYLLRGRMRGYRWDWVVHQDVSVITSFAPPSYEPNIGRTMLAPRGARTCVAVLSENVDVTRCLRPGVWSIVSAGAEIVFDRIGRAAL